MVETIYSNTHEVATAYNHDYVFIVSVKDFPGIARRACFSTHKDPNGHGKPFSHIALKFHELGVDDCEALSAMFAEAAEVLREASNGGKQ